MVAVFGSFVTANVMEAKQFGFALAAAVALDATLIRLILVPALMRLFGTWNWWLPQLRRQPAGAT
jgi:RND superfamily putative drug exporter